MDLGLADHTYIVTGGHARPRPRDRRGAGRRGRPGGDLVPLAGVGRRRPSPLSERPPPGSSPTTPTPTPRRAWSPPPATTFGRLDGALISVGGPPAGPDLRTHRGRVARRLRLGVPRRACGWPPRWPTLSTTAARSRSSSRRRSRRRSPNLGISNGLRPGLAMAAKTLADELGPRGIRVNGLMPGPIDTDRARELDASIRRRRRPPRRRKLADVPLGRYGEPEEFGRAAAFLLSPAAGYPHRRHAPGRRRSDPQPLMRIGSDARSPESSAVAPLLRGASRV